MTQNIDLLQETTTEGASGNGGPSHGSARANMPGVTVLVVGAIVVLFVALLGAHYWAYAGSHVSTDDAYVSSDNTLVSPQVSGQVSKVMVSDNQPVKVGQLLVVLDDASYRTAVQQAKANLSVAVAQANGAGATISLTEETSRAQIAQAQGIVGQAESGIVGAEAEAARMEAGVASARAGAKTAAADVATARAALSAAMANKRRFANSIDSAQAAVDAAKADYDRASRDSDRARKLFASGAISEQAVDQADAVLLTAKATLAGRRADLSAAEQQLVAAEASIEQSNAQLAAAQDREAAAGAVIHQAEAQSRAAHESIRQAGARRDQAIGQLAQARTAPAQISVSRSAKAQALAKVDQARAALTDALLKLSYTRIHSPVNGIVGRKSVEVGDFVQAGSPLLTIVEEGSLRVTANFKETQLADIRDGERAELRVDALRGRAFSGRVDSLSKATGATFALLPPDNATGNFTKVVQRVPVKIVLDPDQPGLEDLRAGLSVVAVIETRGRSRR